MKKSLKTMLLAFVALLCFVNMTCENDDDSNGYMGDCDQNTVVDSDTYKNLETDRFTIISAEITGDCLNLEIGASGCDGSTWRFSLVDSGAVAESFPEQRYLKLQLLNEELCDAYFTKTISFDLTPLRVSGSNEIILHIEGLETSLNYKY
ncbi:hypothetical protein ABI125_05115 [Tamlana crocina]